MPVRRLPAMTCAYLCDVHACACLCVPVLPVRRACLYVPVHTCVTCATCVPVHTCAYPWVHVCTCAYLCVAVCTLSVVYLCILHTRTYLYVPVLTCAAVRTCIPVQCVFTCGHMLILTDDYEFYLASTCKTAFQSISSVFSCCPMVSVLIPFRVPTANIPYFLRLILLKCVS